MLALALLALALPVLLALLALVPPAPALLALLALARLALRQRLTCQLLAVLQVRQRKGLPGCEWALREWDTCLLQQLRRAPLRGAQCQGLGHGLSGQASARKIAVAATIQPKYFVVRRVQVSSATCRGLQHVLMLKIRPISRTGVLAP